MNPRFLMLTGLLLGCPVLAAAQTQTSPTASDLDLSLPKSATDHRNDPPGTWYGDTSGVPASTTKAASAPRRYSACPTTPDGKDTDLTGSVSAGIGYSNRGGNSNYQAARVNYCKEYATDSGDSRVLNISVGVSQSSGPDGYYGGGWGPYYAPRPMGGMRPR